MNLKTLLALTSVVEVEHHGETLRFEYTPNKLDGNLLVRLFKAEAAPDASGDHLPIVAALAELLVSWDLTDDDAPTEPSEAMLMRLPLTLLVAIKTAMIEHLNGARPTAPPLPVEIPLQASGVEPPAKLPRSSAPRAARAAS